MSPNPGLNNVSEDLNLYQQESKSCALSIKLETPVRSFPEVQLKSWLLETHIYKYAVSGSPFRRDGS